MRNNRGASFASFCGAALAAIANGGGAEVSPPLVVLCLLAGIVALAVACGAIYALVYLAGAHPARLTDRGSAASARSS